MRIAIIGYGKMGKAIESLAQNAGDQISLIIDKKNREEIFEINPSNTDVAIEFTQPETAFNNISLLVNQGVKTISGTTGWLHDYEKVKQTVESKNGTFLYASNFSLGVNLFFELNKWLAEKMNLFPAYRPSIEEIHHIHKKDKPSGTAITLAEGILMKNQNLKSWSLDKRETDSLPIFSIRETEVPGTHMVSYKTDFEEIEIKHTANNREIFAQGVIDVAHWITNHSGLLTYEDYLNS